MKCDSCGGNMHIALRASAILDGRVWYCGNGGHLNHCRASKQIPTILLKTYEIFQAYTFESIHQDVGVFQHAVADYRRYATDVLVDYVETHSEKVGGPGKIVKIDKSKIGKIKFKRGHFVEGQWVFGGVERDSERCFIVAIQD